MSGGPLMARFGHGHGTSRSVGSSPDIVQSGKVS
jgi:hypothetical protein